MLVWAWLALGEGVRGAMVRALRVAEEAWMETLAATPEAEVSREAPWDIEETPKRLLIFMVGLGMCACCTVCMASQTCCKLAFLSREESMQSIHEVENSGYATALFKLKMKYLLVWGLAVLGDWLQGAYVYKLYSHYGFEMEDIALLFLIGYVSSLFFGLLAGVYADLCGRKRAAQIYALFYIISIFTKHSREFSVLAFGRVLAGISTSLLWTTFEAWITCEHAKGGASMSKATRELWDQGLPEIFGVAVVVSSLLAILAGFASHFMAEYTWGYVAPFDLAAFVLAIQMIAVQLSWQENYSPKNEDGFCSLLMGGFQDTFANGRYILVLLASAGFEAAMFNFVFLWTPALEVSNAEAPLGLVFTCFMFCVMIGANIFRVGTGLAHSEESENSFTYTALASAYLVSVLAFAGMFVSIQNDFVLMTCFMVFEVCVGIFWGAIARVRSREIGEEYRATVYNVIRTLTNLVVILCMVISTTELGYYSGVPASESMKVTDPLHKSMMWQPKAEHVLTRETVAAQNGVLARQLSGQAPLAPDLPPGGSPDQPAPAGTPPTAEQRFRAFRASLATVAVPAAGATPPTAPAVPAPPPDRPSGEQIEAKCKLIFVVNLVLCLISFGAIVSLSREVPRAFADIDGAQDHMKYQSYADEHDDNFGGEGANYARAIDPLVVNPRVAIKKTI